MIPRNILSVVLAKLVIMKSLGVLVNFGADVVSV